jgi:hypothetical protein
MLDRDESTDPPQQDEDVHLGHMRVVRPAHIPELPKGIGDQRHREHDHDRFDDHADLRVDGHEAEIFGLVLHHSTITI